jgi:hypothetical protein
VWLNRYVLGRVLGPLERAVLHPENLSASWVFGIALTPCVAAGIWLFREPAVLMLGVALGVGLGLHVLARLLGLPTGLGPTVPALVGVSLIGPGAEAGWSVIVATAAGLLELTRASLVPSARNETGILAYAVVFLAARGGMGLDHYVAPGSGRALAEPVRLWLDFFSASQAPIDPVRLYVGNVPGPVFATSLLAVAIATAWFWYARRLSLVVVAGFVLGALVPIKLMDWNAGFQLESGPLWFTVALVLADRDRLPAGMWSRPLLGFATGVVAVALRTRGVAVEGVVIAVAGLQMAVSVVETSAWAATNRLAIWRRLRRIRLGIRRRPQPEPVVSAPQAKKPRRVTNWSRRGPTPTRSTGAPASSEIRST